MEGVKRPLGSCTLVFLCSIKYCDMSQVARVAHKIICSMELIGHNLLINLHYTIAYGLCSNILRKLYEVIN